MASSLSVHLVANDASSGLLSESPPDNEAAEVELWLGLRIKFEANERQRSLLFLITLPQYLTSQLVSLIQPVVPLRFPSVS